MMEAVRFGVNIKLDEESRKNLRQRDGIASVENLRLFEERITQELGQYQDLNVELKPADFRTQAQGGLMSDTFDIVQVSGPLTDSDSGKKLKSQISHIWIIEPWETMDEVTDGVIQMAKTLIRQFNIQ